MDADELPAWIAGLRTVRTLATGPRSVLVLLQHPDGVVAKLWHRGTDRAGVDRELSALAAVEHPHVLRLIDAETLADGRVAALLPRIGGGSASRLLERRDALSLGEAITLIAPIAAALSALHEAGAAHGSVDARRVLLDDAGAPVLTGFARASLFRAGLSPAARASDVAADDDGLRRYAEIVLGRVEGTAELRRRIASIDRGDVGAVVLAALFVEGSGEALRPADDAPVSRATGSGRVIPLVRASPSQDDRLPVRRRRPREPSASDAGDAISRLAAVVDAGSTGVRSALTVRWRRLPRARRLLLLGVAAAVGTAISAAVLVPGADSGAARDPTSAPTSSPPARATRSRVGRAASPTSSPSTAPTPVGATPESVVRGAEPIAAATVLLSARAACLREPDRACFAAVDESGSSALTTDLAAEGGGGRPLLPAPPFRLIDRLGDAALLGDGSDDIRILVIDTDAGWRIREITDADAKG